MRGESHKPVIPKGYRWRDWAADPDKGRTGPDLLKYINDDLLPKLRSINGSDEPQVIASVFGETFNRMLSGYLVRDIFNLMDGMNFNSADDIHTQSHLYESILLFFDKPGPTYPVARVAKTKSQATIRIHAGVSWNSRPTPHRRVSRQLASQGG